MCHPSSIPSPVRFALARVSVVWLIALIFVSAFSITPSTVAATGYLRSEAMASRSTSSFPCVGVAGE